MLQIFRHPVPFQRLHLGWVGRKLVCSQVCVNLSAWRLFSSDARFQQHQQLIFPADNTTSECMTKKKKESKLLRNEVFRCSHFTSPFDVI